MQLTCPQVTDGSTGFLREDPGCDLPYVEVGVGNYAAGIQKDYELLSGELVNATLAVYPYGLVKLTQINKVIRFIPQPSLRRAGPDAETLVLYFMDFSSCPDMTAAVGGAPAGPPPGLTSESARRILVPDGESIPGSDLKHYIETCSTGQRIIPLENVSVVGPVPVPCSGALPLTRPRPDLAGIAPAAARAIRMNATHKGIWNLWGSSCEPADLSAIERTAEAFAQQEIAKNPQDPEMQRLRRILAWRDRRRSIFVLPPGCSCSGSWPALAESSCTGDTCSVFIEGATMLRQAGIGVGAKAAAAYPPHILMHELLHVLGMGHARAGGLEAGDQTDIMGAFGRSGAGLLCPSAPSLYRLGWAQPISPPGTPPFSTDVLYNSAYGNLTAANFSTGSSSNWIRGLVLPAQGTRNDNMLVVNVGAEGTFPNARRAPGSAAYFFSFRVRNATTGGYDSGLGPAFHRKVLVHAYNGTRSQRGAIGFKSELLDFGPNFNTSGADTWVSPFTGVEAGTGLGGGVKLVVREVTDTQAVVDVCRIVEDGKESLCTDGQDNDCDGLFDDEDPDCA